MFKTGAFWKWVLVTTSQDLPTTGPNTNSCVAEPRTRLLSNGAKHRVGHPLPILSQELHALPAHCSAGQLTIPLYKQREQPPAFTPGLFISSFSKCSGTLLESKMSPVLKTQLCKAPLRLILQSYARENPRWH